MNVIVLRCIVKMVVMALISAGMVIEVSRIVPVAMAIRTISAMVRIPITATPVASATAVVLMRTTNIDVHATGLKMKTLSLSSLRGRS